MGYEIDFLPVGEESKGGDAIAFRYGDLYGLRREQTVGIVDGGYTECGDALVEHVEKYYATDKADFVVSTHTDQDHICGLKTVLEKMRVGQMLMHLPWDHSAAMERAERRARLVPGLLAILPFIVLFAVLGLRQIPAISYVLGILAVAGVGPVLIAGAVRNFGRAVEQRLWASWGGPPTTTLLRLTLPTDDEEQRDAWRKAVEVVSGVSLLSLRAERRDKTKADNTIKRAIKRVRDKTRDKEKFALLFKENRDYGYERNVYSVRWAARGVSFISALALLGYMVRVAPLVDRPQISAANLAGLALCLLCFFGWGILPSEERVKDAADRYASELLHAAVTLQEEAEAPGQNSSAMS